MQNGLARSSFCCIVMGLVYLHFNFLMSFKSVFIHLRENIGALCVS